MCLVGRQTLLSQSINQSMCTHCSQTNNVMMQMMICRSSLSFCRTTHAHCGTSHQDKTVGSVRLTIYCIKIFSNAVYRT